MADKGEMQEMNSPHLLYFISPLSDPQNNSWGNVSREAQAHFETGTEKWEMREMRTLKNK